MKLNAGVTVLDVPGFVKANIEKLKNGKCAEAVMRPRYDDLLRIKELTSSGNAG